MEFCYRRCDRRSRAIELSQYDIDRDSSFLFFNQQRDALK